MISTSSNLRISGTLGMECLFVSHTNSYKYQIRDRTHDRWSSCGSASLAPRLVRREPTMVLCQVPVCSAESCLCGLLPYWTANRLFVHRGTYNVDRNVLRDRSNLTACRKHSKPRKGRLILGFVSARSSRGLFGPNILSTIIIIRQSMKRWTRRAQIRKTKQT